MLASETASSSYGQLQEEERDDEEEKESLLRLFPPRDLPKSIPSGTTKLLSQALVKPPSKDIIASLFALQEEKWASMSPSDAQRLLREVAVRPNPGPQTRDLMKRLLSVPNLTRLPLTGASYLTSIELIELVKLALSKSPGISHFHFRECQELNGDVLSLLRIESKRIDTLDLGRCYPITDGSLGELWDYVEVEKIQFLSLQGCYLLSYRSLASFIGGLNGQKSSLTHLNLSYCQYMDDETLIRLWHLCPLLSCVNLEHTTDITPYCIEQLARSCSLLTSLSVTGLVTMHDQVLAVLAESCPSLTSLNLAQCGSISSLGVERLAQGCKGLALLNLSYCEKVTDTAILHLAGHCNQLEELILTNLEVGSPAINSLLSRCGTRLSNLSLSGTLIDGSSVEYLLGFCSILRDLDLSFCHQIPFENIKDLIKRAGSLRKVTLWGISSLPNKLNHSSLSTPFWLLSGLPFPPLRPTGSQQMSLLMSLGLAAFPER